MQQPPTTWPSRLYLPQGIRTWHRVLVGVCAAVYLIGSAVVDVLLSTGGSGAIVISMAVLQILVVSLFLDAVVRAAYLEGTVLVSRRLFGIRRCDLSRAPAVRLERKTLGLRLSAYDGRRWMRVHLRPRTYRGPAAPHPLVALAGAVLAGPPRPEPAGREAWLTAQQLRELAVYRMAPAR